MTSSAVPVPVPAAVGTAPASARRRGRRLPATLVIGATIVALVVLTAVVSFIWTPYDATQTTSDRLLAPGGTHPLGTDALGRDVFSQLLVGARTTLYVGVIAVGLGALLGIPLGLVAAMGPRRLSEVIMRLIDLMLAFPALLLAIVFGAIFGASTLSAMIAIGLATAPTFARLSRSGALQVMSSEYVLAARVAGRPLLAVAFRHVVPNIGGMLIVQVSVSYAVAVLSESGLSYLGFGTPPPTPSWGRMLQEAQPLLFVQPLLAVWPGVAIALAVLGFNLLGDGLRDRFDPKLEDRS
jgi:peptide/nickel transport system permease protein